MTEEVLLLKLYLEHNSGLNYYVDIILPCCYVDCSCEALWVGSCLAECHLHTGTYTYIYIPSVALYRGSGSFHYTLKYLCQFDEQ